MIEVSNLTKNYGNSCAVKDASFVINKGRISGLLGPNGAGKTTVIRMICGAIIPDSGSIKVKGFDVINLSQLTRSLIGYLPETPALYPELTAREQLVYCARLKGINKQKLCPVIDEILKECSISDVKNKLISKLSKGYKQRLGIAQALIGDPDVVVLDEPTTGLDPVQIIEFRDLITRRKAGGATILISSHILSEIQNLCDDVTIMDKGSVLFSGNVAGLQVMTSKNKEYHIELSNVDEKILGIIATIEGVLSCSRVDDNNIVVVAKDDNDVRSLISKKIVDSGYSLMGISINKKDLENYYLKLINGAELR